VIRFIVSLNGDVFLFSQMKHAVVKWQMNMKKSKIDYIGIFRNLKGTNCEKIAWILESFKEKHVDKSLSSIWVDMEYIRIDTYCILDHITCWFWQSQTNHPSLNRSSGLLWMTNYTVFGLHQSLSLGVKSDPWYWYIYLYIYHKNQPNLGQLV